MFRELLPAQIVPFAEELSSLLQFVEDASALVAQTPATPSQPREEMLARRWNTSRAHPSCNALIEVTWVRPAVPA